MKLKHLLILLGFLFFAPKVFAANYTYYRSITVTSTTSVASGTLANFPMLFSGTYTWLESTSTGGRIQNLVTAPNGGQEPADLIFVTSTPSASAGLWSCGTALNFETESYVSSTGVISDWINTPTTTASQVLYACYGNSSVSTDQSHPSSTWNSNYKYVDHFGTATTLNASDSTKFANNSPTVNGTITAAAGQIVGAMNANTNGYYFKTISSTIGITNTVSVWMNANSFQDGGGG